MKPEYFEIFLLYANQLICKSDADALLVAIGECEALASKPSRELTDSECAAIWNTVWAGAPFTCKQFDNTPDVVREILKLAAIPEPEYVDFDAAKWYAGGWQAQACYSIRGPALWENTDCIDRGYAHRMRRKP